MLNNSHACDRSNGRSDKLNSNGFTTLAKCQTNSKLLKCIINYGNEMELNHFIPHKKVFQILDAEKIFFKKNYLIDVFFIVIQKGCIFCLYSCIFSQTILCTILFMKVYNSYYELHYSNGVLKSVFYEIGLGIFLISLEAGKPVENAADCNIVRNILLYALKAASHQI